MKYALNEETNENKEAQEEEEEGSRIRGRKLEERTQER